MAAVHRDTDSGTFHAGIQLVKQKTAVQGAALSTKKDLVMSNYVQFLAAKMTLDDINRKFLST